MNTPSTYHIAISGTFDVENYGDLMFPIMAEHELSRRLGSVHLTRYSYLEKVANSWPYDVTPLSRLNSEISNHSGLLIGGGHLIRFDKDVAKGYYPSDGETHHPTGYWLTPALAAANAAVPVYWNGPSASLDTPAWGAPLLRAALSLSEYVAVRDEPTASELRKVGYSGQCSIIPDTVFGLPGLLPLDDARKRAAPLLEQAGITGPYIVVQAKSELANIAQTLAANPETQHLQILVVSIGPILGEHPSLITDAVPTAKSLDFWPAPLDIAALIAASAGTVAISLHLTITSLCYGLPVLRYSRYRLTKYEVIEASKNVFLHPGGTEAIPENFIAHLTHRRPCAIAQQAKSVLDAHWEQIARSLSGERRQRQSNFFRVWNAALAQSEELAQQTLQAESASKTEITALRDALASQDQALGALIQERDQVLNALSQERDQALKALSQERDQALNALSQERDQALNAHVLDRDQLRQALTEERDQALKALSQERDQALNALTRERDQALKAHVLDRDQLRQALNALTRERDQLQSALTEERKQGLQSFELQAARHAELEAQAAQAAHGHSIEVHALRLEQARLEQALGETRQVVAEREARILAMLGSRSWRLMRPLRMGTSAVRKIKNRVFSRHRRPLAEATQVASSAPLMLEAPATVELEEGHTPPPAVELAEGTDACAVTTVPDAGVDEQVNEPVSEQINEPVDEQLDEVLDELLGEPAEQVAEDEFREEFDEAFYVESYPDVAASGMDPYRHYIEHGKAEQRLPVPPPLKLNENLDATRAGQDYVLVVCHDATRTGAPILGWNISRELSRRYNVVALLLGDGDIMEPFLNDCAAVAGPYDKSARTPKAMGRTIADLNERFKFAFAIVNSIASRSVLRPLAEQYVPSVLLIHEFSKFHCYPDEIVDTLGWAGEVVFPAKIVQNNAVLERTLPAIRRSHIVPQGKSVIPMPHAEESPASQQKTERERQDLIRQVLPDGNAQEKPFIVLGAGSIEYRKGVDLFIAAAAKLKRMAPERKILMVWVGRTYDVPEHVQYRAFLEDQIQTSDLKDRLIILDETPHLDALYQLADLFFVSARLDPLPNVAIDAMTSGTPLICFEGGTGVAEILSAHDALKDYALPYLNVQAAAQAILDLSGSPDTHQRVSLTCKFIASETFDLPRYVQKLESLALGATTATYQRRADEVALADSAFVPAFYHAPRSPEPAEQALRTYLKQSQSRIYIRKPAPGFNPASYAEHAGLTAFDPDPLLHWQQAGRPQGPWQEDVLELAHADIEPAANLRIGVHIHAYYPDLLASILDRMELNKLECDYLISVPNAAAAEEVASVLATRAYEQRCLVRITTNRGRDIGPFFTEFAEELAAYDVIGHFHTKKSPHVTLSNLVPDWIEFLLENMIGGKFPSADAIITAFSKDQKLGLVFADDPHLIGWDKNREFAETLAKNMGMEPLSDGFFPFPVGTMFWARPQALAPIFDQKLGWDDYPKEPVPIDGTMLHALERLLPSAARHVGYTHLATYAEGINR
ncbi:rhamnan synthesis F family protein [Achromobacter arsenitoxydans]|uniref:Rhamnan synthesis F n=1 Tax=Achromobacter arsenitoxydans SY8 TaxID=477184 RepID=H0F4C8_9BURK|nr:rhamnan synthesis F family protein [Achromobacter arsenitoxydans]EHK66877.1 Rhamnan synthesis F [Achromobacter arsenitoxydans SY8]